MKVDFFTSGSTEEIVGRIRNELGKRGFIFAENEKSYNQAIEKFEREGKGYLHESIDRYQRVRVHGTPEQCAEQLKMYIKEGVQQFTFYFIFENQLKGLKLFGERVIPFLKKEFE